MYKQNLVLSIKSAGKFLQETKDNEVFLPFLSEYSIFLKNKNNRRAVVSVEIDGKDVLNGNQLIIEPNSSIDLERFIENDLDEGRKFRFIEKTKGIIDYRGHQPEDGLIKISFKFEKEKRYSKLTNPHHFGPMWVYDSGPTSLLNKQEINDLKGGFRQEDLTTELYSNQPKIETNCSLCDSRFEKETYLDLDFTGFVRKKDGNNSDNAQQNIDGITVKGSESKQKFRKTFFVETEPEEYIMILKLKGQTNDINITEPITKKSKKRCPSCGKNWEYSFTYCPDDATFLENN